MDFKKMKELLAIKGVTQREMCNDIGINEPSLSGIKSGAKKAGVEMVLKIAKYLNIHPIEIAPEFSEFFDFLNKGNDQVNNTISSTSLSNDYSGLMTIANNLSISNRDLAQSTKELAISSKESMSALIELARQIIIKEK